MSGPIIARFIEKNEVDLSTQLKLSASTGDKAITYLGLDEHGPTSDLDSTHRC